MQSKPTSETIKSTFDPSKVINTTAFSYKITPTPKDFILYALGIRISKDPMNTDDFKFTYENDQGFTCFPTYIASAAAQGFSNLKDFKGLPPFDLDLLLHGSEDI